MEFYTVNAYAGVTGTLIQVTFLTLNSFLFSHPSGRCHCLLSWGLLHSKSIEESDQTQSHLGRASLKIFRFLGRAWSKGTSKGVDPILCYCSEVQISPKCVDPVRRGNFLWREIHNCHCHSDTTHPHDPSLGLPYTQLVVSCQRGPLRLLANILI